MTCHAGSAHAAASDRAAFGWLCPSCWARVIKSGAVQSCGCLLRERLAEHVASRPSLKHGHAAEIGGRGHHTAEYACWVAMRRRCHNPRHRSYRDYGGRGIVVCERWRQSFEAFLDDVGHRPGPGWSLDRINVNGNYEPGNVRWATARQQYANRRLSRERVERLLSEYEPQGPDLIAKLRKELLG